MVRTAGYSAMFRILRHSPFRAAIVEDYRRVARPAEVFSARLDYLRPREAMNSGAAVTPHMPVTGSVRLRGSPLRVHGPRTAVRG